MAAYDQESVTEVSTGDGSAYRIRLPFASTDHIQRSIRSRARPYEEALLRDAAGRLVPGDTVIDVGANVGNHSLFLAAVAHASVIAVEPSAVLGESISGSFSDNGLSSQLTLVRAALGAHEGRGALEDGHEDNLGARAFLETEEGETRLRTLDSLIDEGEITRTTTVAMVKIDVEGAELAVLQGGARLLAGHRPLVYVECHDRKVFDAVVALLRPYGYRYVDTFNWTPTHLFATPERASNDELPTALIDDRYAGLRRAMEWSEAREDLTRLGDEIANLHAQLAATARVRRAALADADAAKRTAASLEHELTRLRTKLEASKPRERALRAEIESLRTARSAGDGPASTDGVGPWAD